MNLIAVHVKLHVAIFEIVGRVGESKARIHKRGAVFDMEPRHVQRAAGVIDVGLETREWLLIGRAVRYCEVRRSLRVLRRSRDLRRGAQASLHREVALSGDG